MIATLKTMLRKSPFVRQLIYVKGLFRQPATQNDETAILQKLLAAHTIPKRFVEFGFSGWEFNCASLVKDWDGLLLDADDYNILIAKTILPRKIRAEKRWLTLETLDIVRDYAAAGELGILSVDVDGNDYWFLRYLIDLKPAIIIAEYNSSFGRGPITVPYNAAFDRTKFSPTWPWADGVTYFYFGTSLAALAHLTEAHGYALMEIDPSGVNAFFMRKDLLNPDDVPLCAEQAYREQPFPDGSSQAQRWEKIKAMPFVDVTTEPTTQPTTEP